MEELEVGAACVLGGSERWAVVLMQLAAPQEPPSPPPPYSQAPLVTLSLSPLSISSSLRTLGAPPCLYSLEVQGVGPQGWVHGVWRDDFPRGFSLPGTHH